MKKEKIVFSTDAKSKADKALKMVQKRKDVLAKEGQEDRILRGLDPTWGNELTDEELDVQLKKFKLKKSDVKRHIVKKEFTESGTKSTRGLAKLDFLGMNVFTERENIVLDNLREYFGDAYNKDHQTVIVDGVKVGVIIKQQRTKCLQTGDTIDGIKVVLVKDSANSFVGERKNKLNFTSIINTINKYSKL